MACVPDQVKDIVFKIKSLQQKIRSVTVGAGAANSPYIYVIFDKEAAAQFAQGTKVYLSWKNLESNVRGYNVLTQIAKKPNTWRLTLPQSLLTEGNVLARFELVDDTSIAPSQNFEITVLGNPLEGSDWIQSDDFSAFQESLVNMTKQVQETQQLLKETQQTVNDLNALFGQVQRFYNEIQCEQRKLKRKTDKSLETSYEALQTAMTALNHLAWGKI